MTHRLPPLHGKIQKQLITFHNLPITDDRILYIQERVHNKSTVAIICLVDNIHSFIVDRLALENGRFIFQI